MSTLSKEKRQRLILVVLVTILVLTGLYWIVIRAQQASLRRLASRKQAGHQQLQKVKQAIQSADQIEAELGAARKRLDAIEEGMASGDLYSWAITTIRTFKLPYKLDIPQYSQIDGPKDCTLLADFPYKQATWTVAGTATFNEFGKFVADFENQYPYFRVLNLSLEPAPGLASPDKDKLSFKLDISAPVKPGAS